MIKKEKAKDNYLRREFISPSGVPFTLQDYKKVLDFQGGLCYICKKKLNKDGIPLRLAVDHKHNEPAIIRGLLCWPCNKGIAVMQDDPQRCYNAYLYLSNPPVTQVLGERLTVPGRLGTAKRKKALKKILQGINGKKKQTVRKMVKKQKRVR